MWWSGWGSSCGWRIFTVEMCLIAGKSESTAQASDSCVCVCVCVCVCARARTHSVAQSCLNLWDTLDCSLPDSSMYGIFQARILKWVAISYSRGSSWARDQTHITCISCIVRRILYHCLRDRHYYLGHLQGFIFDVSISKTLLVSL